MSAAEGILGALEAWLETEYRTAHGSWQRSDCEGLSPARERALTLASVQYQLMRLRAAQEAE